MKEWKPGVAQLLFNLNTEIRYFPDTINSEASVSRLLSRPSLGDSLLPPGEMLLHGRQTITLQDHHSYVSNFLVNLCKFSDAVSPVD